MPIFSPPISRIATPPLRFSSPASPFDTLPLFAADAADADVFFFVAYQDDADFLMFSPPYAAH